MNPTLRSQPSLSPVSGKAADFSDSFLANEVAIVDLQRSGNRENPLTVHAIHHLPLELATHFSLLRPQYIIIIGHPPLM